MPHYQQATFDLPGGTDEAPYAEIFEVGGYVRVASSTSIDIMCTSDLMTQIREIMKPTQSEAPTGDAPTGDAPTGDTPTGDTPPGDTPPGDTPPGDTPPGA